jgi:hypothetical protein
MRVIEWNEKKKQTDKRADRPQDIFSPGWHASPRQEISGPHIHWIISAADGLPIELSDQGCTTSNLHVGDSVRRYLALGGRRHGAFSAPGAAGWWHFDGACNVGAAGGVLPMSCNGPAKIMKRVPRKREMRADLVRGDMSLSGQGCSSSCRRKIKRSSDPPDAKPRRRLETWLDAWLVRLSLGINVTALQ